MLERSILSTSHRTFDMPEGKFSFLLGLKILIPNSRFAPKEKIVLEKGMSRPWPFQKQQKFKSSHNDCGPQKSWLDGILLVAILISDRKFQDQSFACWNFITFLNGDRIQAFSRHFRKKTNSWVKVLKTHRIKVSNSGDNSSYFNIDVFFIFGFSYCVHFFNFLPRLVSLTDWQISWKFGTIL